VQSISVIPEAIVRDVYIKECGQLLRIEDKLLVEEVAKRREANAEKTRKAPAGTGQTQARGPQNVETRPEVQTAPATDSGDPAQMPPIDTPPFPTEEDYGAAVQQRTWEEDEFHRYESLIIQAVVRYGELTMCEVENENGESVPMSVTGYVAAELKQDDLTLHNPVYQRIMAEAINHDGAAGFVAERYFVDHPDTDISRVATELASDRYQLSKYHSKSQKIVSDEERLCELVPMLMIDYKNAIVESELKRIVNELKDPAVAADAERCNALMTRFSEVKQVESMLAKRLGDRVVLR
jgi:DNA primase